MKANPWTVQTFIVGDEYSTCAICKEGKLLAFTDNAASLSCFNYLPARNDKLREWVATFVAARKLSGVACFDFIVGADGEPYWLFAEVWAALSKPSLASFSAVFDALFHKKDAYYDPRDPLPSLALLHVHLPTLLARNIYKG